MSDTSTPWQREPTGDAGAAWLEQVVWNAQGLVPVIAQSADTEQVLTLAWMNREALAATVASGEVVYWSRSRGKLWRKGEISGNVQRVVDIRLDCDSDALLLRVEQVGGVACHTGRASCFFQRYHNGQWDSHEPVLVDPARIYGSHE